MSKQKKSEAILQYPFINNREERLQPGSRTGPKSSPVNFRIVFRYAKPLTEVTGQVVRLLSIMDGEMSRSTLQQTLGLRHRDNYVETYLQPALEAELIEMTLPDKPNSRIRERSDFLTFFVTGSTETDDN